MNQPPKLNFEDELNHRIISQNWDQKISQTVQKKINNRRIQKALIACVCVSAISLMTISTQSRQEREGLLLSAIDQQATETYASVFEDVDFMMDDLSEYVN